jgi:hypothetical protein
VAKNGQLNGQSLAKEWRRIQSAGTPRHPTGAALATQGPRRPSGPSRAPIARVVLRCALASGWHSAPPRRQSAARCALVIHESAILRQSKGRLKSHVKRPPFAERHHGMHSPLKLRLFASVDLPAKRVGCVAGEVVETGGQFFYQVLRIGLAGWVANLYRSSGGI